MNLALRLGTAGLVALCLASARPVEPGTAPDTAPGASSGDGSAPTLAFAHFALAQPLTWPAPPSLPAVTGGVQRVVLELRSERGTAQGAPTGDYLGYSEDLVVDVQTHGGRLGHDLFLEDAQGTDLGTRVPWPAGQPTHEVFVRFAPDPGAPAVRVVDLTLGAVRGAPDASGEEAPAPVQPGENACLSFLVERAAGPVVHFSHTSPETWPLPSTKVARRGHSSYWGLRLLDRDLRTEAGEVGGLPTPLERRVELRVWVGGDARLTPGPEGEPVEVRFHEHDPVGPGGSTDGPAGPEPAVLEPQGRVLTFSVPAGEAGWALWTDFLPGPAGADPTTLELRLLSARTLPGGEPLPVGWNDRVRYVVVD